MNKVTMSSGANNQVDKKEQQLDRKHEEGCIFCKIVKREEKSNIFWEDSDYMAFLSIFPNTKGTSVVIPKTHYSSYAFDLPENIFVELSLAARKVAKILDQKLDGVGRTAMVFEGFGVDHVHAKLFPMHGTGAMKEWHPINSSIRTVFDQYPGYISSHDGPKADGSELEKICDLLKSADHGTVSIQ